MMKEKWPQGSSQEQGFVKKGVEHEPTEKEVTEQMLKDLETACFFMDKKLYDLEVPDGTPGKDNQKNNEGYTLEVQGKERGHTITLHRAFGEDDATGLEDVLSDGDTVRSIVSLNASKTRSGREITCVVKLARATNGLRLQFIRYTGGERTGRSILIGRRQIYGVEADGIHTVNQAQLEWRDAWRAFQKMLLEDPAFSAYVEKYAAESHAGKDERWYEGLSLGVLNVDDAEKFLAAMEDVWKAAHRKWIMEGKKFPRQQAPRNLGKKEPADTVIPHEEFTRMLEACIDRLGSALEEIEQRLTKKLIT